MGEIDFLHHDDDDDDKTEEYVDPHKALQEMEPFVGYKKFRGRTYHIREVHNYEDMIGLYCMAVVIPGVNHKPQVFAISIREHDNQRYENDPLMVKRPALFHNRDAAMEFANQFEFPKEVLRVFKLEADVCKHNIPKETGAYIMRYVSVVIPDQ